MNPPSNQPFDVSSENSDSTRDLKLPSAKKEIPGYRIRVIAEGATRGGNLLYDASYPVITIQISQENEVEIEGYAIVPLDMIVPFSLPGTCTEYARSIVIELTMK